MHRYNSSRRLNDLYILRGKFDALEESYYSGYLLENQYLDQVKSYQEEMCCHPLWLLLGDYTNKNVKTKVSYCMACGRKSIIACPSDYELQPLPNTIDLSFLAKSLIEEGSVPISNIQQFLDEMYRATLPPLLRILINENRSRDVYDLNVEILKLVGHGSYKRKIQER